MIVRPVLCRPFIGRREELAYLRERRIEAASSHGQFVFIAGDAGIGKSRLISEFCSSLAYSRWRIADGACLEFGNRPYGPILEALSRIDERPFTLGSAATKEEQFDAIVERFTAIAARTALVVVLEDLHWADAATLEFLAYFGERMRRSRILLVASFRPADVGVGGSTSHMLARISRAAQAAQVNLAPLHGTELRALIDEALSGLELPAGTRLTVARISEGNPFFAEELLKGAVERHARRARANAASDIPTTIRTILLERMRTLDDDDRRIIAQAAVIGRSFSLALLAATLGIAQDALMPALRRARDAQLIEEHSPAQFRFRHVLTREAIYGDFLTAELGAKHHAIARILETAPATDGALEALAYHWRLAGDAAKAISYHERAGDAAALVYAHEDAIAFYEGAAALAAAQPSGRAALMQKIADRRLVLGLNEEARAEYAAAAELHRAAHNPDGEAICLARAAMTAYTTTLVDTSAPLVDALERIDPEAFLARSRLHLAIAWISVALRLPTRAQRHLRQVDPRAMTSTDIGVRYHNVAAAVSTLLGDIAGLRRDHAAWLQAAQVRGLGAVAGAHYNGARSFTALGLHDEALAQIREALEVARASRNRHAEECAQATAALCFVASGDLMQARAAVDAVPVTTDNRVNMIFAAAAGTLIGAYTGDDALVTKWFDACEATIVASPEIECGAGFAEALVRRGRPRDAEALLRRALPECETIRGEVMTLLAIGRYGSLAERLRARAYLERAAVGPSELVERPALALFDAYACVRRARHDEATELAGQAAEGFLRLRFPLLEAEARELAGDLDGARAIFASSGAVFAVRRLDGMRRPTPAAAAAGPLDVLSAREREIVTLATGGQSNLEIARSLGITHKTVEKHLSSVYRKLDVASRKALRKLAAGAESASARTGEP